MTTAGTPEPTTVSEPLIDSVWLRSIFRPLMVVALVTCLGAGFVGVAQAIDPGWGRGLVIPFLALVAAQSAYTTLWLAAPQRRLRRGARVRLGELLLALIIARVLAFAIVGAWPDRAQLSTWLRHPLSFLDGTSVFLGFLTVLVWSEGALMMSILEQMSLKPDELFDKTTVGWAPDWNEVRARHPSRAQLSRDFSSHWLWGGLALALCAGISRVELMPASGRLFGISQLGLSPLFQIALVVYFLGGLLLLSQGRLAVLRARWRYEGTPADPEVTRRWGRIGIGLIGLIGLIAALLPFGSSFMLAQLLMLVLNFVMQVMYILLILIMSLFGALLSLLGLNQEDIPSRPREAPPELTEVMRQGAPLPDWIGGALVWIIMICIVAYSLIAYLGGRGVRLNWSQLRRLWQWVQQWLRGWHRRAQAVGQRLRAALASRRAEEAAGSSPWGFLSLRRLDPRGQIRYFYLATARRAADRGVPRQPAETPREYEYDLESEWPEIERDLAALTESFIHARYSAHDLRPEDARSAQELWRRIKAALRARDRAARGPDSRL